MKVKFFKSIIALTSAAFILTLSDCSSKTKTNRSSNDNSLPSSSIADSNSMNLPSEIPSISVNSEIEDSYKSNSTSALPEVVYEKLDITNKINTHIGQTMKVVGTVERNKPTISNGGLDRYPTYGSSLKDITDEEKDNILAEDKTLRASDTTFTSMDKDGNYYLNGTATGDKLYKHTASVGMYYGDVSDDEVAVIKEITINPRPTGNYITGLFAPAGEIIKIEMSEEDLNNTGGLSISIGQTSQRNHKNNIWKDRNDFCRMPYIVNEMSVTSTTAYVGYALGGPIYIAPKKTSQVPFKVTISGAVEYPYFIYGYTTEADLNNMKNLSAPYFDFEIWDNAVRHSGPKKYVNLDYQNLMMVSHLWMNIVKTSKQVPTGSLDTIGITFLYDPFIAAGGAVAFVGGNWCNLPPDWMSGSLDYENFTSNGMWGTIHEYNHHFQRYGFVPGDEVTNNAVSLLSYVNYTNISSKRTEDDKTLVDWNAYTDPSRSLRETITNSQKGEPFSSLSVYADIIHTFGSDIFIKATQLGKGAGGVDTWFRALVDATGYDMSYYFEQILHQKVSDEVKISYQSQNLPMFVPVASLYQTGRSYLANNEEHFSQTVQPYLIDYGKEVTLDLENHLYVPDGFTFTIKSISDPEYGQIEKINDKVYKYIPDAEAISSGQIKVKISLHHDTIKTPDITLIIELKQEYAGLDATKYYYSSKKYNTIDDAIANDFAGYESKTELKRYYSTFMNGITPSMIGVIEGKIYIPEDGKYAICFRSDRGNHVLYTGVNTPNLVESIDTNIGNSAFRSDGEHVLEFDFHQGDFLYFKEIIISSGSFDAYMEIGWSRFINGEYTKNVTIPSNYLMNKNYDYKRFGFKFVEKYQRIYNATSILANRNLQSVVSCNYQPWDENYNIERIFDGDNNSAYHSQNGKLISSEPFVLTVDLGEKVDCDTLYIHGYNKTQIHMPITFKLYGGTSLNEMALLGDYTNQPFENRLLSAKFEQTKIRYYRLEVTDTDTHRYVAIAEMNVGLSFEGIEESPDVATYYNFKLNNEVLSTYGHVVEGNGYLTYSFEGTQFGFYAVQNEECQIRIEIDGKTIELELNAKNQKELAYISSKLAYSNHNIKITVIKGMLAIDSFIYR